MRIPSGKTDQAIYFVAQLGGARVTGLSGFTVVRSRNGAADVTYTTPTTTEIDATTMPGVYSLLIDEDTTIASTSDSEEMALHITKTGMDPVTRTIELYRRAVTTGNTLDVTATGAAGIDWANVENPTTAVNLSATNIDVDQAAASVSGVVGSVTGLTAANLDVAVSSRMATYVQPAGFLAATFPSDPADQSLVIAATDALATLIGDVPTNAELATALASADDATLAAIAALSIPTANANADALLDRANAIETGLTLRNAVRLLAAVLAGKASGGQTGTETFRNAVADSKDRLISTNDSSGNRTAVTVDLT